MVAVHCREHEDKVPKAHHGEDVAEDLKDYGEEGEVQLGES